MSIWFVYLPNVFMRFVYNVFRKLIHDNTIVLYLDDILIPAQSESEGLEKLKRVLKAAADNGLEINFKKCQFLKRKIEFLGYVIENGTIQPSPSGYENEEQRRHECQRSTA
ncbi:hypothetical protein AVEN_99656-1 [Araneus ventricosus]|uniref:Reverse transcriptase domain-containing protein n=1 Tax=Araneus ventricosus TaxID=182803 RepID=A0A4Y2DP26_ARAVE|nr:hypothetical protein AVEN_99656-1 [Araneus ventricosus]